MDSKLPAPDDVVADKYVVERVIGQGAVSVVVAARHAQLGQCVALKFLRPELAQRPEVSERFRRQARAAAAVTGEHVCRVLDVCTNDSGVPYVVMEYAEGRDLAAELAERGSLPYAEAVDYVLQACEGLAEGWVAGVVHGDLKPSKMYLTSRQDGSRCLKLLDLGTSEISREPPELEYLAPEQREGSALITGATNVWALGVVLVRALTGHVPSADEVARVLREVRLPEGLGAVVERCLAPRPDERFGSIAELAQALAPFAPPRARVSAERVSRLLPMAAKVERPARSSWQWKLILAACVPPLLVLGWAVFAEQKDVRVQASVRASVHAQVQRLEHAAVKESEHEHEHEHEHEQEDMQSQEAQAQDNEEAVVESAVPRVRLRKRVSVPPPVAAGFHVSDFGGRR